MELIHESNAQVMTWGEFKKAVDAAGVTDDTPIDFIDYARRFNEPPRVFVGENGLVIVAD